MIDLIVFLNHSCLILNHLDFVIGIVMLMLFSLTYELPTYFLISYMLFHLSLNVKLSFT
jgi:hypothetical protein